MGGIGHVELLALSDPIYHHHDILFSACPLADWLVANPLVRDSGPLPSATSEHEPISINDLDAILSFECYDPIWDWPTELHSCRMVGVFHDAVPFRIDEKDDPSRYYRAVGKMVSRAHFDFLRLARLHSATSDIFPTQQPPRAASCTSGTTWIAFFHSSDVKTDRSSPESRSATAARSR